MLDESGTIPGADQCEMALRTENVQDEAAQSTVDVNYTTHALRTINEQRVLRGEDPVDQPEANMLLFSTPQGPLPIEEAIKLYEALPAREFAAGEPIDLGALVEVESDGGRALYFTKTTTWSCLGKV